MRNPIQCLSSDSWQISTIKSEINRTDLVTVSKSCMIGEKNVLNFRGKFPLTWSVAVSDRKPIVLEWNLPKSDRNDLLHPFECVHGEKTTTEEEHAVEEPAENSLKRCSTSEWSTVKKLGSSQLNALRAAWRTACNNCNAPDEQFELLTALEYSIVSLAAPPVGSKSRRA